ncbi:hypothetical protein D3C76_598730 [compost metagenome]
MRRLKRAIGHGREAQGIDPDHVLVHLGGGEWPGQRAVKLAHAYQVLASGCPVVRLGRVQIGAEVGHLEVEQDGALATLRRVISHGGKAQVAAVAAIHLGFPAVHVGAELLVAAPAHAEAPGPGLVAESGHLDLLDLGAQIPRPAALDCFPRPGAAREVLDIHAVEVVDRRHGAADLEHLGHVLRRVGLGLGAVADIEGCPGTVPHRPEQATEGHQLAKATGQGVVDHVLDRDRGVERLVVGIAAGNADVVEGLPLGQVQVIVGVAALLQLVDAPRHDVAGWAFPAPHQRQDTGSFPAHLALRLRREPISAPDVAGHNRQAGVAGGRTLQSTAQVGPGGVVSGLIIDAAGPVLVQLAKPRLSTHRVGQEDSTSDPLGIQRAAVCNLLDHRPRAGQVHVTILNGVVGRDFINLPFSSNATQAVGIGDRPLQLDDFFVVRTTGERPPVAALQVRSIQGDQAVDGLHGIEARPAAVSGTCRGQPFDLQQTRAIGGDPVPQPARADGGQALPQRQPHHRRSAVVVQGHLGRLLWCAAGGRGTGHAHR